MSWQCAKPESEYAEDLLELIEGIVLSDPGYVARLERHDSLVKKAASDLTHPAYDTLQKVVADDAETFALQRRARREQTEQQPRERGRKRRKRSRTRKS